MSADIVGHAAGERDPLLPVSGNRTEPVHNHRNERNGDVSNNSDTNLCQVARPGPLEISRSNRYAILAGIWIATFLSVSRSN